MSDQIPAEIYGVAAFLTVSRLMETLIAKGDLTEAERADIWALVAGGLDPPDDPRMKAMRELLRKLSGSDAPQQ